MKVVLTALALLAGTTAANAETISWQRLLDPLGLFTQAQMEGRLGETTAPGSRHLFAANGTRGGGGFLKLRRQPTGGGKVVRTH